METSGRGAGSSGGGLGGFGVVGEVVLLGLGAPSELGGGVLELLVFDELADEVPAGVVVVLLLLAGGEVVLGEEGAALDIHEVGGHDDELGGEFDVEHPEGLDVGEVAGGDFFEGDGVDVEFLLFDEVEEEVEGALEDLEVDFVVVGGFHGLFPKGRGGEGRALFF